MNRMFLSVTLSCSLALLLAGCKKEGPPKQAQPGTAATVDKDVDTTSHTRAGGSAQDDNKGESRTEGDHAHDEVSLGSVTIGDMNVELAQGHGKVEAGKEGHLVVKLPYNDKGATIVRAWIGTEDRTMSQAGKGEYAPSHDDYDVHAVAPDPLPENVMWWIEIQRPDGSRVIGSAKPLR
ncbi:MAG: hypothetical protein HUU22_09415 [Phycisphaerae bacterium]|nr:hypothetical protein [Phycisphaerae bacterium]NUQ46239.1 hypothetical protein [Phycisphaerae bacterium]